MKTAIECVAAGALQLDEQKPKWEDRIDTNMLHMNSCMNCILGQLYRHYEIGCGVLNIDPEEHGFERDVDGMTYEELHDAWIDEIAKRKQKKEQV